MTGGETKSSLERSVFVFVFIITRGGVGKADPASRRSGALNETLMKHPCLEESGGGRGGPQKKKKKKEVREEKNTLDLFCELVTALLYLQNLTCLQC